MEMTRSGLSTSFTSLTISVISPSFSPSLPPPSLLLGTYGSQGRRLEHARRSLRRCPGRYHYYLGRPIISPSLPPSLPPSLLLGTYGSQGRRPQHARRSLRRCLGRYHYYLGGFVKGEEEEAFARGAAVAGGGEEGRREGGREGGREEGYVEC